MWKSRVFILVLTIGIGTARSLEVDLEDEPKESGVRLSRSIGNFARLLLGGNVPPDHPLVMYPDPIYSPSSISSKVIASVPGMTGNPNDPQQQQFQQQVPHNQPQMQMSGDAPIPAVAGFGSNSHPFSNQPQYSIPSVPSQWQQQQQQPQQLNQASGSGGQFYQGQQTGPSNVNNQVNPVNPQNNAFGFQQNPSQAPGNAYNPNQYNGGGAPGGGAGIQSNPTNGNAYGPPGSGNRLFQQAASTQYAPPQASPSSFPQRPSQQNIQQNYQAPQGQGIQAQTGSSYNQQQTNQRPQTGANYNNYPGGNSYSSMISAPSNNFQSQSQPPVQNYGAPNAPSDNVGQQFSQNNINQNTNNQNQNFNQQGYNQNVGTSPQQNLNQNPGNSPQNLNPNPEYSQPQSPNPGYSQPQNLNPNPGYSQPQSSNPGYSQPQNLNPNPGYSQPQSSNPGYSQPQNLNTNPGYSQPQNQNSGYPQQNSNQNSGYAQPPPSQNIENTQQNVNPNPSNSLPNSNQGYASATPTNSPPNSFNTNNVFIPQQPSNSQSGQQNPWASSQSPPTEPPTSSSYLSVPPTSSNQPGPSFGGYRATTSRPNEYVQSIYPSLGIGTGGSSGYSNPNSGQQKTEYGPPKSEYGPPKSEGPPKPEYGPPNAAYSPPLGEYGSPSKVSTYYGKTTYGRGGDDDSYSTIKSSVSSWPTYGNGYSTVKIEDDDDDGSYRPPVPVYTSRRTSSSYRKSPSRYEESYDSPYRRSSPTVSTSDLVDAIRHKPTPYVPRRETKKHNRHQIPNLDLGRTSNPHFGSIERKEGGRESRESNQYNNEYLRTFKPLKIGRKSVTERYRDSRIDTEGLPLRDPKVEPSIAVFHTSYI